MRKWLRNLVQGERGVVGEQEGKSEKIGKKIKNNARGEYN